MNWNVDLSDGINMVENKDCNCSKFTGETLTACKTGLNYNVSYICNKYQNDTNLWNACQSGRVYSI